MTSREQHDRLANAIRILSMDAVEKAKSGHPGLPMGAADIATVLYTRFLKYDPKDPHWPDRDLVKRGRSPQICARGLSRPGHGLYLGRVRSDVRSPAGEPAPDAAESLPAAIRGPTATLG